MHSQLFEATAAQGLSLKSLSKSLNRLLDGYGAKTLEWAINQATNSGTPHLGAVRQILETGRTEEGHPPPVTGAVPNDPRLRELAVQPHNLSQYDHLMEEHDDQIP